MRVVRLGRSQKHEDEECDGQNDRADNDIRHRFVKSLLGFKKRMEGKNENTSDKKRGKNVGRGVNTEVHTREGNEKNDCNAYDGERHFLCVKSTDSAEGGGCVLRVSRGEGVAGRLLYRISDGLKAGVLYPRARNLTDKL